MMPKLSIEDQNAWVCCGIAFVWIGILVICWMNSMK